MLAQRLRRCPNIQPTLVQSFVSCRGKLPYKDIRQQLVYLFKSAVSALGFAGDNYVAVQSQKRVTADLEVTCLALRDGILNQNLLLFMFSECKTTETGEEYGGQISHTATGKTCRRWDSRHPHCHYLVSRGRSVHSASVRGGSASSSSSSGTSSTCGHFPAARIEDSANFCRNPDPLHHPLGPWCLTSDPVHGWDYCDIPLCGEKNCLIYN